VMPRHHRIHYLELFAAMAAVEQVITPSPGRPREWTGVKRVLLFTDNSSAMWNLVNGYSSKAASNALLFDFYQSVHRAGVKLHVEHVPGRYNPADDPSRYTPGRKQKQKEFRNFLEREYGTELPFPRPGWLGRSVERVKVWKSYLEPRAEERRPEKRTRTEQNV